MSNVYAGARSKYYDNLLYLVNRYGYTKKFSSVSSNIDGRRLSAMNNRGLFDEYGFVRGKSYGWKVNAYKVKKSIFDQVIDRERKLADKCQNDITL